MRSQVVETVDSDRTRLVLEWCFTVNVVYIIREDCTKGESSSISAFIIWLQQYARSDWLFLCNDRALLARCPRHIQSVFNLIVDILMDIHVMVK